MDDWTQISTPVHSKTKSDRPTSAPSSYLIPPRELAMDLAARSCSCGSEYLVAGATKPASANPFSVANFTRVSTMSAIATRLHPSSRAATAQSSPTAPAPIMMQLDPCLIPARRQACTATARGSSSAPSSRLNESGSLKCNQSLISQLICEKARGLTCESKWLDVSPWIAARPENAAMPTHCL